MNRQCTGVTKRGTPCGAKPLVGSQFCYYHDPTREKDRKAASAAGGRAGKLKVLPPDTPRVKLRTPEDVDPLIEATINSVLRGEITHQVANSVAIFVGLFLKSTQLQMLAERLSAIEALDR